MEIAVPMYVFFVLQSTLFTRFIEEQNRGGSQPNISASQYGTFSFPLPPIDIQEAIVEIITQSYDNLSNINQLIGKLEMMREGILNDLLTHGVTDDGNLQLMENFNIKFGQIPSVGLLTDAVHIVIEHRWYSDSSSLISQQGRPNQKSHTVGGKN